MRVVGRRRSSWSTTCWRGRRSARNGRSSCPARSGLVFRTRRANQAAARLPDRGDEAAAGRAEGAHAGRVRPVLADRAPAGRDRATGSCSRCRSTPRSWRSTGSPIGLLEGTRGRGQRVLHQPRPVARTARWSTRRAAPPASRRPVWVSREGAESPVDPAWQPQGIIANFALSPDGRALAVDVVQNGVNAIWVKQLPAGPFSRLTFGDTGEPAPDLVGRRALGHLPGRRATNAAARRRCAAPTAPAARRALLRGRLDWGQALRDPRRPVAGAAALDLRAGQGRHLRRPDGRHDAGAAGHGPGDGGRRGGVARRAVAGVRVGRVGRDRGLRAPLPRRRRRRGGRSRPRAGPIRCGRGAGGSCSTSARRTR